MARVKLLFFCIYNDAGDDDTLPYIRGFHLRNLVVSKRAITFLGCLSHNMSLFYFHVTVSRVVVIV